MKKKIVIGAIVTFIIVVLIGGFAMMKKTVKQESLDLVGISAIVLNADAADVTITLTDDDKMTVTQYSKKKVTEDFSFTTNTDDSTLAIVDNGKEVSWLLGMKGVAGISYDLKIPKVYEENICIKVGTGNVEYVGENSHKLKTLDVQVAKGGDVKLSSLWLLENSTIFTGGGNVDVNFVTEADCMVTGESLSGNVTISEHFKSGKPTLTIKSNQGNITVKRVN
ncbi:MAG: DUF4097 family beta strand repeat-containing protein [Anaerovoracaceae bacterium]